MTHKKLLEALVRTLKDINGNHNVMGGITVYFSVYFSGYFRQIILAVPKSNPVD